MQSVSWLALAATVGLTGCALLGFGPPSSIIEGTAYLVEDGSTLPYTEVCAFGLDTTCIRADDAGHYRMRRTEQTLALRFRAGQMTAITDTLRIVPPGRYQIDCAISGRLVISEQPPPCLPGPAR
jgi:hypothetical protein